ncbi:unnamed protein product [Rotaria magnacalcarata]|uniref:Uncharacterized protein n=1 Tax=Rotaria magnacalcarata TaxID=392030 RepID=A0A8S2Q1S5_9BILA|nr:unnamed protein product [Rotaria magnacalcarata]
MQVAEMPIDSLTSGAPNSTSNQTPNDIHIDLKHVANIRENFSKIIKRSFWIKGGLASLLAIAVVCAAIVPTALILSPFKVSSATNATTGTILTSTTLSTVEKSEEQTLATIGIFDQRKTVKTSSQYSPKDISYQQYIDSRIACEYRLISMYARDAIINMWTIWSNTSSHRLSLEKFSDYTSIVKLLRSMNDHYTCISIRSDDRIDPLMFLIKPILQNEIKALMDSNYEILPNQVPLLCHLQKDIIIESIRFMLKIL